MLCMCRKMQCPIETVQHQQLPRRLVRLPPSNTLLPVLLVAVLMCAASLVAGVTVAPMALPLKSAARLSVSNTNASGLLTNEENIVSSSSSSSSIGMGLNQTERFRRLIPYMTFYVPGSASGAQSAASGADYLPVNQAYSYAPANQPLQTMPTQQQDVQHQHHHQRPQQQSQQLHQLHLDNVEQVEQNMQPQTLRAHQPHRNVAASSQQQQPLLVYQHTPQNAPPLTRVYAAYGGGHPAVKPAAAPPPPPPLPPPTSGQHLVYAVRPLPQQQQQQQHATIVYKTRHQAHKPHKPYASQQQPQQQQQPLLPLSTPSPALLQQQHADAGGQPMLSQQQSPHRINYSYQLLPQSPATVPTKKKLTPFLSTNQLPGEFRPVQQQIEAYHHHQHHQQQPQQQPHYAEEQPSVLYKTQSPDAPHLEDNHQLHHATATRYGSENIATSTPGYVQFLKAVKPLPTAATSGDSPTIPDDAMPLLQAPQLMAPPMSHQAFGTPADHAAHIGYRVRINGAADSNANKVYYSGFDYGAGFTLDPNDGYAGRVPSTSARPPSSLEQQQQHKPQRGGNPNNGVHIANGKYGGFASYRPTTAPPLLAAPTPFRPKPEAQSHAHYVFGQKLPVSRPHMPNSQPQEAPPPPLEFSLEHKPQQRPFEHQPLSYEHIRPQKAPQQQRLGALVHHQRPTPIPNNDVRQHLTETTHIEPLDQPEPYPHHRQYGHAQPPAQRQTHPPQLLYNHYQPHPANAANADLKLHITSTPAPPMRPHPTRIVVPDEPTAPATAGAYEVTANAAAAYADAAGTEHRFAAEPDQHLGSYETKSAHYADVLQRLQQSKLLPQRLNGNDIDVSIKSLVDVLNALQQRQRRPEPPAQYANEVEPPQAPPAVPQLHSGDGNAYVVSPPDTRLRPTKRPYLKVARPRPQKPYTPKPLPEDTGEYNEDYNDESGAHNADTHGDVGGLPGPNTGRPGIDYPALAEIPATAFNCKEQRYKGFFGDPETNCQVWHYCDLNGGQASFLCPNGTIFSQVALTCDWWFNVKCSTTTQLYVLNERLYKYILPFSPKFPEDYTGPVVDKYLTMKYAEMEEKMRREKAKNKIPNADTEHNNENDIDAPSAGAVQSADFTQPGGSGADSVHAAALLAATADGAQIDDDGQRHNVDSAVQYVDDGDTVREADGAHRPQFAHLRSAPAGTQLEHVIVNESGYAAVSTTANEIDDAVQETTVSSLGSSSTRAAPSDDSEHGPELNDDSNIGSTMAPAVERDVATEALPPMQHHRSVVMVESERVELIEIKSDGSSGHLTPAGYR